MALVQTTTGSNALSTTSIATSAFGSNTTTGNCIIVAVGIDTALQDVQSMSDGTNTYTKIKVISTGGGTTVDGELWYAKNITGLTTPTITATFSGTITAAPAVIIAREYSGIALVPLDKNAGTGSSTGTPSSGATATTTQASELVIGVAVTGDTTTETLGSGFGNLSTVAAGLATLAMEDMTVSSTGTQTATFGTSSTDWGAIVGTFKLLPASGYYDQNNDALAVGTTSSAAVAVYGSKPATGDLMIATVKDITSTTIANTQVSDSNGNWTLLAAYNSTVASECVAVYGQIAASSQPTSISAANLGDKNYLQIHEFSGNLSSIGSPSGSATTGIYSGGIVDTSDGSGDNTTVMTTNGNQPSVTTTNAGDLIITLAGLNATPTINPTWTNATQLEQNPNTTSWIASDAYQIESSTGTYTPYVSWTGGTSKKFQQITVALLPATTVATLNIPDITTNQAVKRAAYY